MPLAVGIGIGLQHVQVPVVDQSVDSNDSSFYSDDSSFYSDDSDFYDPEELLWLLDSTGEQLLDSTGAALLSAMELFLLANGAAVHFSNDEILGVAPA
jgi:hypothetical protein